MLNVKWLRILCRLPVLKTRVRGSADPRGELLHGLVDRGGPDGLEHVEVVVGTGQLAHMTGAHRGRWAEVRTDRPFCVLGWPGSRAIADARNEVCSGGGLYRDSPVRPQCCDSSR